MSANAKHTPMCKRRDCFNAAFSDGYCGAHLKEHRTRKAGSYRAALAAERDSLREINADLLSALKDCAELMEDFRNANGAGPKSCGHVFYCICASDRFEAAKSAARAAIAAAEGGKP